MSEHDAAGLDNSANCVLVLSSWNVFTCHDKLHGKRVWWVGKKVKVRHEVREDADQDRGC